MNVTVPHWTIDEALKRVNENPGREFFFSWTADTILKDAEDGMRYACAVILLAEMIAKYEPHLEPIDPLLAEAREIAVEFFESARNQTAADQTRSGDRDQGEFVQTVLRALRRGKELAQ